MYMLQHDTRCIWQGLWTIKDYRGRTPSTVSADPSLADDLNYARFEASNNTVSGTVARDEHAFSVTEHGVRRSFPADWLAS